MRSLPLGRRPSVSPASICWAGTLDRPYDDFVRQGKSTSWVVGVESKDETSNLTRSPRIDADPRASC